MTLVSGGQCIYLDTSCTTAKLCKSSSIQRYLVIKVLPTRRDNKCLLFVINQPEWGKLWWAKLQLSFTCMILYGVRKQLTENCLMSAVASEQ